jgi:hypothetical protein
MHNQAATYSTGNYNASRWSFGSETVQGQAAAPVSNSSESRDERFHYVWPDFLNTIVAILSDGELHDVDEVRNQVISAHSITPQQLRVTQANGLKSMFMNTVAQAFARLTATRAVVRHPLRGGAVAYRMTPKGLSVVGRVGVDRITIRHFVPSSTSKSQSKDSVLFRLRGTPTVAEMRDGAA